MYTDIHANIILLKYLYLLVMVTFDHWGQQTLHSVVKSNF